MKCPHCSVTIHENKQKKFIAQDDYLNWYVKYQVCPDCKKLIIYLEYDDKHIYKNQEILVYPKTIAREPLSSDVPDEFNNDYNEACLVLFDSPKASAALSRRCLQKLLREKGKVKPQNLSREIEEVMPFLPTDLSEQIDAIRNIGNFAAHPIKSTNSGEIVEVEDGEAEWLLDILESLFDFYFVRPAIIQRKKEALNSKLIETGKSPMK